MLCGRVGQKQNEKQESGHGHPCLPADDRLAAAAPIIPATAGWRSQVSVGSNHKVAPARRLAPTQGAMDCRGVDDKQSTMVHRSAAGCSPPPGFAGAGSALLAAGHAPGLAGSVACLVCHVRHRAVCAGIVAPAVPKGVAQVCELACRVRSNGWKALVRLLQASSGSWQPAGAPTLQCMLTVLPTRVCKLAWAAPKGWPQPWPRSACRQMSRLLPGLAWCRRCSAEPICRMAANEAIRGWHMRRMPVVRMAAAHVVRRAGPLSSAPPTSSC